MRIGHVRSQQTLAPKHFPANSALKNFRVTQTMKQEQVLFKIVLQLESLRANVTLKYFDVTNAMYIGQMYLQTACLCKCFSANFTRVPSAKSVLSGACFVLTVDL